MEHWEGACRICAHGASSALTLAYRAQPVTGLCPACARDPARLRDFVAVAEAFRRGVGPDGSRGAVRLHRREGLREGVPLVLFARLVPSELRVPGQGRPLPPAAPVAHRWPGRPAVQARATATTATAHNPVQRLWQRLRWGWGDR